MHGKRRKERVSWAVLGEFRPRVEEEGKEMFETFSKILFEFKFEFEKLKDFKH